MVRKSRKSRTNYRKGTRGRKLNNRKGTRGRKSSNSKSFRRNTRKSSRRRSKRRFKGGYYRGQSVDSKDRERKACKGTSGFGPFKKERWLSKACQDAKRKGNEKNAAAEKLREPVDDDDDDGESIN